MAAPTTKIVSIRVFPGGKDVDIKLDDVVAMTLQPYPVLVVRRPDGKLDRYVNCPMIIVDEESSILVPDSTVGA